MDTDQAPAVETETSAPVAQEPVVSGREQIAEAVKSTYTMPEGLSEHAAGVLKGMDPTDMAKFAPYVSKWDSGVTKLVQSVHESYAPFKGLDPDEVSTALEINKLISASPEQAIARIREIYLGAVEEAQAQPETENELDYLPDSLKNVIETVPKLQEMVQELVNRELRITEAEQQAKEVAAYNAKLDELGLKDDIPARNWVTRAVVSGASPEEAVTEWRSVISNEVAKQLAAHNNAPNVLSGKSTVPVEGFDVRKLTSKQTKDYVTQLLTDRNNNN